MLRGFKPSHKSSRACSAHYEPCDDEQALVDDGVREAKAKRSGRARKSKGGGRSSRKKAAKLTVPEQSCYACFASSSRALAALVISVFALVTVLVMGIDPEPSSDLDLTPQLPTFAAPPPPSLQQASRSLQLPPDPPIPIVAPPPLSSPPPTPPPPMPSKPPPPPPPSKPPTVPPYPSLPPPLTPPAPGSAIVATLNARFRNAESSNDFARVGVFMRAWDGISAWNQPWEPCRSTEHCARYSDRFATSIIYPNHPQTYYKGGLVLRPEEIEVNCAYSSDGGSQGVVCNPPGRSEFCTPGCKRWCDPARGYRNWGCSWPPDHLRDMIEQQKVLEPDGGYNEVIVDAFSWEAVCLG